MRVPQGWEMGPFSYMPSLDTARAKTLHLMNTERLESALRQTPFAAAAVSGYSFAIAAPEIQRVDTERRQAFLDIISARSRLVYEDPFFGQNNAGLKIYIPVSEQQGAQEADSLKQATPLN